MSPHDGSIDDQFAAIVSGLEFDDPTPGDELFSLTPKATLAVNLPDPVRGFIVAFAVSVLNRPHDRDGASWFADPEAAVLDAATDDAGSRLSESLAESLSVAAKLVLDTVHLDEVPLETGEAWLRIINAWRLKMVGHLTADELAAAYGHPELGLPLQVASALVASLTMALP